MRGSGILIMVGGLVLGVVLVLMLTSPGERKASAPVSTQTEPVSSEKAKKPDTPKAAAVGKTADEPPGEGQRTVLPDGLGVCWQRGHAEISGWRENNPLWSQELAFPVADVVRGAAPNEVRVVSVDALHTVVLDVVSGAMKGAQAPEEEDVAADVEGLLAKVKALHLEGLNKMNAGDGKGALAACDKMAELAGKLAEAQRQTEAFKIWAAAKKLRRAVAPEQIGKEIPKEQQPGPEDLEF